MKNIYYYEDKFYKDLHDILIIPERKASSDLAHWVEPVFFQVLTCFTF